MVLGADSLSQILLVMALVLGLDLSVFFVGLNHDDRVALLFCSETLLLFFGDRSDSSIVDRRELTSGRIHSARVCLRLRLDVTVVFRATDLPAGRALCLLSIGVMPLVWSKL